MPDESYKPNYDQPKPLLVHLEELRWTIIRSVCWLAAAMAVAIPLSPLVVRLLKKPLAAAELDPDKFLRVFTISAGFSLTVQTIFWTGLVIGMPLVVFEIARFVFPGLTYRERKVVGLVAVVGMVLFVGGAVFSYFTALPVAIRCFLAINKWIGIPCEFVDMANYITLSLQILAAFGMAFEIPLIIFALGAIGLVTTDLIKKFRRHAIIALAVLAMVITPSTDPFTMMLLTAVLAGLYELCIFSLNLLDRQRNKPAEP